uniref:non-specific serine/threonine protein kinase n=1 Tax=Peronospora matthiolae TaxID=2874970 RepID=A0AAV1U5V8_9STRA
MTISSVISHSLLINTLGGNSQVPLLENGDVARPGAGAKGVAATEAMLMERFSRAAANESAAILLSGRYVSRKQKLLMDDFYMDGIVSVAAPSYSATQLTDTVIEDVSMGSPAVPVFSQGSRFTCSRESPLFAEADRVSKEDDDDSDTCKVLPSAVDEDVDVEFLAIDHVLQNDSFKPTDLEKDTFYTGTDSARVMSGPKSISSSGELTTGSCCSNSNSDSSHQSSGGGGTRCVRGNQTGMDERQSVDQSSVRGSSQSSSCESEASSNEAEVLFPFVCQSRFVNEFEELSAIGKGGFGQVTLAENRLDGRRYAIKRVGLNLKNQTSKTLQKFLREVKILALLDHANIVRYYQAWLEKVEESTNGTSVASSLVASDMSSVGGLAAAANYSTNNLLAPISELEFPGDRRDLESFYSNGSVISDNADDGGFVWERETSSMEGEDGWKEEDLVVQNKPRMSHLPPRVSSSCAPAAHGSDEDSSCNAAEKCDHWLYIQMQYCAGRNLADYLAVPTRPMELSRMLKIFVQIASALMHVHSCGLIHRDLKPANIFVADVERDEIKLGDFGLSRYAANASSLNASASLDDPQQGVSFQCPEQVAGKKYNAKTDIYSLGMILFELCHERFGTTMERYITLRDARDSKFPADLRATKRCPEILDMLSKLLSHDPTARPTANEVVQWGQMMYETSLAQKAMDVVRSPRNLGIIRAAAGASFFVPGIDHFMVGIGETVVTTTFCLKVEAAMEHCSGEDGGERRLPNHNLLKQICDVIAGVHDGKVEIKKCGLHMENEGVTILAFELDPQSALAVAPGSDVEGSVVLAIEALAGVQTVHRVSKID